MSQRIIETSIDIEAPIERVWHVLSDFPRYPQWSRFIQSIEGTPNAGARLSVQLNDGGTTMRFRPEVLVCGPHELRWRGLLGASFVFTGEHRFLLEALSESRTRLIHSEVFSGILVSLLWKRLDTATRQGFQDFNAALRARSEHPTL